MEKHFNKMRKIDYEALMLEKIVDDFSKEEIPLKIRKIKLLETVGMPVSKVDLLNRENLADLSSIITAKIEQHNDPLKIRFACIPDKFSMPFFYIEKGIKEKDKNEIIEQIYSLIKKDRSIKYLILQEATPVDDAKNKISGRILFTKGGIMPIQEILEIYKGARSTGILNNVNVEDPNFLRFIKQAGGFMKPENKLSKDSSIKEEEIREIYTYLNSCREKIEIITQVIIQSQNRSANNQAICLEFSYRNGAMVFSDIDY